MDLQFHKTKRNHKSADNVNSMQILFVFCVHLLSYAEKNTHKNSMTKKLNQATLNSLTMPYIFIQTIYQEIVLSYRPIPIGKVTVGYINFYIYHAWTHDTL